MLAGLGVPAPSIRYLAWGGHDTMASILDLTSFNADSTFPEFRAPEIADWSARLTWAYLGVTGRGVPPWKVDFSATMDGCVAFSLGLS